MRRKLAAILAAAAALPAALTIAPAVEADALTVKLAATPNYPPVPPPPNASATATPTPVPAGDLAATGGPDWLLLVMLAGLLLIVVGLAVLATRRDRPDA